MAVIFRRDDGTPLLIGGRSTKQEEAAFYARCSSIVGTFHAPTPSPLPQQQASLP